jgi:hypothetical protein
MVVACLGGSCGGEELWLPWSTATSEHRNPFSRFLALPFISHFIMTPTGFFFLLLNEVYFLQLICITSQ